MTSNNTETPFLDLPQALVEEMLAKCGPLGEDMARNFREINEKRDDFRKILDDEGLLQKDSELLMTRTSPTTCGVDGAFAIERLLSTDMIATAAVAVEGLTPPSEDRHWPEPHHLCHVDSIPHSDATSLILRAIMICRELELAESAPHDVIMIDGSLSTPLIYLNMALNRKDDVTDRLTSILEAILEDSLNKYKKILESKRSDQIYAGLPKYTTKKEISDNILKIKDQEDRGLLSFILESSEFIGPLPIEPPKQPYHITHAPSEYKGLVDDVIMHLNEVQIMYYRPYLHMPALRLEIPKSIASNSQRLSILCESLKIQCGVPAIIEPFPLYLADRMVKHLGTALPAIRRSTTQEIALKWEENLGNMYLAMHGYRTERG